MATVTLSDTAPAPPGAVAYACSRLGFRVFPLRTDTGTPAFTEWPDRASTDRAQLQEWWTGEYRHSGVGIATGPESGIWVLDIDVKDADGFKSLRSLAAAHHCGTEPFTQTMVVRTPSSGAHVYFRWNEASAAEGGIRNSAKALAPGLDVRGIRGYVRAPGVGAYTIVERAGARSTVIASAPEWLVPLCKKRRNVTAEPMTNADVRYRMSAQGRQWGRFQALEAVRRLGRSPAGTRNDNLNKTAYQLGRLSVSLGEPTREDALRQCLAALHGAGANDSPEAQIRTFTSGWEAGRTAETTKVVEHRTDPE